MMRFGRLFSNVSARVVFATFAGVLALAIIIGITLAPYRASDFNELRAHNRAVRNAKCASCHSFDNPIEPSTRSAWDEFPALWGQIDIVCEGTFEMPPLRYKLLHWGSWLTSANIASFREETSALRRAWLEKYEIKSDGVSRLVALPVMIPFSDTRARLGRTLFQKRVISGDGTVACADCHRLNAGGADGLVHSRGSKLNTPTVFNVAFSSRFFHSGCVSNLSSQVELSLLRKDMMNAGTLSNIVERLSSDSALVTRFELLYPDGGLVSSNVVDALVEYERSLLTPGGAFDRYLSGNHEALSEEARRGLAAFTSLACDACHSGPALGGISMASTARGDATLYKVPTLRKVADTAPYFHNGSISNLESAVEFMALKQRSHSLSPEELAELSAFLKSL